MGRHSVNQRFHRINSNGALDLQFGGLAVSARVSPNMVTQKLTSPLDLLGASR